MLIAVKTRALMHATQIGRALDWTIVMGFPHHRPTAGCR
jgi:hypothetical protein